MLLNHYVKVQGELISQVSKYNGTVPLSLYLLPSSLFLSSLLPPFLPPSLLLALLPLSSSPSFPSSLSDDPQECRDKRLAEHHRAPQCAFCDEEDGGGGDPHRQTGRLPLQGRFQKGARLGGAGQQAYLQLQPNPREGILLCLTVSENHFFLLPHLHVPCVWHVTYMYHCM